MKKLYTGIAFAAGAVALTVTGTAMAGQRGVSDKEVVFGMHTALSGPASPWGVGAAAGIRMRFDEINADGGIHGRKLKIIIEDHGYQVPKAIQAANKLINRDNIFAMLGALGTPMNNAAMKMQLAKKVPNLFPFTAARSMHEPYHKLKFALFSDYYDHNRAGIKYFVEKHGKKAVCAMYQDTDFGHETRDAARDQTKAMGMKLVAEATHTPRDTDFTSQLGKMKKAGCDLIALGTIIKDTIIINATAKKMGMADVVFVGNTASYDQFTAGAKGGIAGGYYALSGFEYAYSDTSADIIKAWANRFKEMNGKEPNGAAQLAYSSADMVVQALDKAGKNLTTDSFIAALEGIQGYRDIFGAEFSFSATNHKGSDTSMLSQIVDGRWKLLEKNLGY
ncbi:MAG: ABC transporter substrate-binding protein [Rhodospirillales bacterium]|nr:ABC transporter substrate-binding protein [Rhodospirillales bacterium]